MVVMEVTDGLETGGQRTQLHALRDPHVRALDQAEDAAHPLRVSSVDIGNLGVQLAGAGLEIRA